MTSKHKIVNIHELGTNCWVSARFVEGARCQRVFECLYPEKKTCKAVAAERAYIKQRWGEIQTKYQDQINKLKEG